MAHSVWKYELDNLGRPTHLAVPALAELLDVQQQKGQWVVWALVDPHAPLHEITIERFGTGFDIPDTLRPSERRDHISTVQEGPFVWHFFRRGHR
jgi:hypothetical protein